ncbi:MAG TPA: phosphotransferase, partial [Acidimicrobiales bacterium]
PGRADAWAGTIERELGPIASEGLDPRAARDVVDRLRHAKDPGLEIRVHGDYHLGQVMRTDTGWFVLDFEGEPARPVEERAAPWSPLKDVAGMLRSFQYAAAAALNERGEPERTEALYALGGAWEMHNRGAFLDGYRSTRGISELVPGDDESFDAVLAAFELEKAIYELAYELAYRPDWALIPRAALERILSERGTS